MSLALSRKWRPARFEEVVGQEHITRTLKNSVTAGRVGHAYLFCGPRGTGKTTTARLIAKAVNCLHEDLAQRPCNECQSCLAINDGRFLDLIEIDAASNTSVDDVRDLREKINFVPSQGRFKVYIVDEVHMLSTAAFNALLKTLEEPPEHAIFVLATTEEHKVPLTIKSRCQQFNARLLTEREITQRLEWLAEQEGLSIEPAALALIARQGAGSIRDAESLLDQLVTGPGQTISLEVAQMVLGTATDAAVIALTEAWLSNDGANGLAIIHDALSSGADARQFCRQMVAYLRQLLLVNTGGTVAIFEGTVEQQADLERQAKRATRQALIAAVKRFGEAASRPSGSWQPQLQLELAFIELLAAEAVIQTAVAPGGERPGTSELVRAKLQHIPPAEPAEADAITVSPTESGPAGDAQEAEPQREPAATGAIGLEQVKQQWRKMLAEIAQENKNLPPLLAMSKPLAVEGTAIILGFDYPIFKSKFDDTPGAAQVLGAAFSQLLGANCTVRCVVTSEYAVPIAKDEVEALAEELGGVVREE